MHWMSPLVLPRLLGRVKGVPSRAATLRFHVVLPADASEAAVWAGRSLKPFSSEEPVQRLRRWRLPSREDRGRRQRWKGLRGEERRQRPQNEEGAADSAPRAHAPSPPPSRDLLRASGQTGKPARPASQENGGASGDPLISDPRRALPEWGPPSTRETTTGPRTTALDKSGARAADRALGWLRAWSPSIQPRECATWPTAQGERGGAPQGRAVGTDPTDKNRPSPGGKDQQKPSVLVTAVRQLSRPRSECSGALLRVGVYEGPDGLFSLPRDPQAETGAPAVQALTFCGPRWSEAPELQAAAAEGGGSGRPRRLQGPDVSPAPAGFLSPMTSLTHKGGERQSLCRDGGPVRT